MTALSHPDAVPEIPNCERRISATTIREVRSGLTLEAFQNTLAGRAGTLLVCSAVAVAARIATMSGLYVRH